MAVIGEYMSELLKKLRNLLCGGHDTNNNAIRVEDVLRTNNRGIIRNNISRIIAVTIMLLFTCFIIFLYIGSSILDQNHPYLNNIDIQLMDIDLHRTMDTLSLEGTLTLQVRFGKMDNIKVYPVLGTYILSTYIPSKSLNNNNTLSAVSRSTYRISQDVQLIELEFKPSQIRLEEEELKDFQRTLKDGHIWLQLQGDLKMKLKLASYLIFPNANHHIYFVCKILFKEARLDKRSFRRCETSEEPQH